MHRTYREPTTSEKALDLCEYQSHLGVEFDEITIEALESTAPHLKSKPTAAQEKIISSAWNCMFSEEQEND